MGDHKCPICRGDYFNVAQVDQVCDDHGHWILVHKCDECGRASFSDCVGLCMACGCGTPTHQQYRGRKDPRAELRQIGQESINDHLGLHE